MTVGQNIKKFRKEKGLTQKQLGELTGIDEANIRKYELCKQNPKIETIMKIAEGLGISPVDLIGPEWWDIQMGPEGLSKRRESVRQSDALEKYLISLGYQLSFGGPANTEDPDIVLIRGKEKTTFTGDQFKEFEKAIADSVEYQLWQQRNKK